MNQRHNRMKIGCQGNLDSLCFEQFRIQRYDFGKNIILFLHDVLFVLFHITTPFLTKSPQCPVLLNCIGMKPAKIKNSLQVHYVLMGKFLSIRLFFLVQLQIALMRTNKTIKGNRKKPVDDEIFFFF